MPQQRIFYQFLGLHSLLIGVFPFFLPVFLWKRGFDLGDISLFIAAGGGGFCLALWVWDRLRFRLSMLALIAISLLLEMLVLIVARALNGDVTLLALGVIYGAYNCFFWTIQRALFFELIAPNTSGRMYGNFQIFVGLLLQVGILIGAWLLERVDFDYLLPVCFAVAAVGFGVLAAARPEYPRTLSSAATLRFDAIVKFRDRHASRLMFTVDGAFLFLESFFWLVSLFLIAHESFTMLGFMVLSLAAGFALLFYILKNTIDKLGRRRLYPCAVVLYAFSWALRAVTDGELSLELLFISLVVITFCTSFFRLALNKRFYDLAKATLAQPYLILKSYYSQLTLALGFLLFGAAFKFFAPATQGAAWLAPMYWCAAGFALLFLFYAAPRADKND